MKGGTGDSFPPRVHTRSKPSDRVATLPDMDRTDRWQYVKDIRRHEMLKRMGWIVIKVVAEDHPADIIRRIREAIDWRKSTVR
jgi:hypothetical protein